MHPEALSEKNKKVFRKLTAFSNFYLAGGTALALQIGHRVSVDFDLFSSEKIPSRLLKKVERTFKDGEINISVSNPDELSIFIDGTKVTFVKYHFPVLLSFVEYGGIRLLDKKEIGVTKAYAVGRRGSYRDYVDLYFLISEGHTYLEEIVDLAQKKYGHEFNSRLFLEQLIYLEDIEDTEVIFLKNRVGKEGVKKFFEEQIKTLNF